MTAPASLQSPSPVAPSAPTAAAIRQHRARVAAQLLAEQPERAAGLDWDTLARAPAWMGWPAATRALFIRRVGSVLLAPGLRLWIAAAPIAAARQALGAAWWQQLLQARDWPPLPAQTTPAPADAVLDSTGVDRLLHEAGAAVLLASLPHGALRHLASQWLAPVAPMVLAGAAAQRVLLRTEQLHRAEPAPLVDRAEPAPLVDRAEPAPLADPADPADLTQAASPPLAKPEARP